MMSCGNSSNDPGYTSSRYSTYPNQHASWRIGQKQVFDFGYFRSTTSVMKLNHSTAQLDGTLPWSEVVSPNSMNTTMPLSREKHWLLLMGWRSHASSYWAAVNSSWPLLKIFCDRSLNDIAKINPSKVTLIFLLVKFFFRKIYRKYLRIFW